MSASTVRTVSSPAFHLLQRKTVVHRHRRLVRLTGLVLGILFHQVSSAEAALILSATVGGVQYCAPDNNNFAVCQGGIATADVNASAETIRLIDGTSLNGLAVFNLTGQATFDPNEALTLSAASLVNNTGTILNGTLLLGETNFFGETGAVLSASGAWSGNTASGSFVSFSFYNDPANLQGAQDTADLTGILLGGFGSNSGGVPLFSSTSPFIPFGDPNGYSMTLVMSFTLLPGAALTSLSVREATQDITTTPVPEPASLLLLGTGLLGAVARRWRQKR
jgi:hypothetical protein